MTFSRYCKDKWVSLLIFVFVFAAGGGLLVLIDTPFPVICVVEGFYAAGFLIILIQDFLSRRGFYDKLAESIDDLNEMAYLSEFISEPYFQEGEMLCQIIKKSEKYLNDQIAAHQQELNDYKEYVETWVHEVKTPIAVSRLVMENNPNDVTRSLSKEMDKLEGYVEQMLYYSKGSSLQDDYMIHPVLLKNLVMRAVKNQAKYMIAEKVTPRFEDLDHVVLTDSKWMEFILGQIISNSVKYHGNDRPSEIIFRAVCAGRTVTLSVADNGIGIPPQDVSRVFRKGFTGENGRRYAKSTGMGLYLCHVLCQKLDTELSVSSKEGTGTVVSVRFCEAVKDKETDRNCNISKM